MAAINLNPELAKEVSSLKSNLQEKESSLQQISNKLKGLESELGHHNDRYVQVIRLKNNIQNDIFEMRVGIQQEQSRVEAELENAQKVLRAAILGRLDASHSPSMLLSEKIIFEELNLRVKELNRTRRDYLRLQKKIESLEKRYAEYESVETELGSLLSDLERQREGHSSEYVKLTSQKERFQAEYDTLKTKIFLSSQDDVKRARQIVQGLSFSLPLTEFVGMQHEERGVTFKYRGEHKIRNSAPGTVAYTGQLASYGEVVMVDHGGDTRSVYLGHFKPRVKQGTILKEGDLIGLTRRDRKAGELYFEVRKHNIVQNTILLLDQENLLANVISRSVSTR